MSEEPEEADPINFENPEKIIDEIDATIGELKDRFSEGAIHFGQEQERIRTLRTAWESLSSTSVSDPKLAPIYASGVSALASFRDEINQYKDLAIPLVGNLLLTAPSTSGTVALTSSSTSFLSSASFPTPTYVLLEPTQTENEEILAKLKKIDPALAGTYSAIREVLYGTKSDPERGALYYLRQVFDHFFDALAPNDKVRTSQYFKQKEGKDKKLVTRHERLMYAAHTHIGNISRRKTIVASFRHMQHIYDALNSAHIRGTVDSQKAQLALHEMIVLLKDWVNAVDV